MEGQKKILRVKECVVVEVVDPQTLHIATKVKDTASAKSWLRSNGEAGKMYRIAFLRPEAFSIEMPEPKRKLSEWSE